MTTLPPILMVSQYCKCGGRISLYCAPAEEVKAILAEWHRWHPEGPEHGPASLKESAAAGVKAFAR